jgi:hypothetical protein
MYKYVVTALLVAFASTACLAGGTFYLAQDPSKKAACKVMKEKPDGVKMVMIGTATYATRAEAKTAKQAAPECNAPASGAK